MTIPHWESLSTFNIECVWKKLLSVRFIFVTSSNIKLQIFSYRSFARICIQERQVALEVSRFFRWHFSVKNHPTIWSRLLVVIIEIVWRWRSSYVNRPQGVVFIKIPGCSGRRSCDWSSVDYLPLVAVAWPARLCIWFRRCLITPIDTWTCASSWFIDTCVRPGFPSVWTSRVHILVVAISKLCRCCCSKGGRVVTESVIKLLN